MRMLAQGGRKRTRATKSASAQDELQIDNRQVQHPLHMHLLDVL
jgi:hypothetical protein